MHVEQVTNAITGSILTIGTIWVGVKIFLTKRKEQKAEQTRNNFRAVA